MDEVTLLSCHAKLCSGRVVGTAPMPGREARQLARRNGWLTVIHDGAVWDFCPRHGSTDDRAEHTYGAPPPGFDRDDALRLGGAMFDDLTGKRE